MSDSIAVPDDNRPVGKNAPQWQPGAAAHFRMPTGDEIKLYIVDKELEAAGEPTSKDYVNYLDGRTPRPGHEYTPGCRKHLQKREDLPGPSY
jgi:hypothetical protein